MISKTPIIAMILSILLFQSIHPAKAEESYFSVQIGSFSSIAFAERNYRTLLQALAGQELSGLRIEEIQGVRAVRIGRFNRREEGANLLRTVKEIFPEAVLLSVYIREDRIKKAYHEKTERPLITARDEDGKEGAVSGTPFTRGGSPAGQEGQRALPERSDPGELKEREARLLKESDKQPDLIRAKIFARRGQIEQSLQVYQRLRREYPDDEEVWGDYIETLVDDTRYELASHEIKDLLGKNPLNARAGRLQARIYRELGMFRSAFPLYEGILQEMPNDATLWSDYADARQEAGDWSMALDAYCRALELDPENRETLRRIHAILWDHRPRLESGYRLYRFKEDDTSVRTLFWRYRQDLSPKTNLELDYQRINIDRTAAVDTALLEQKIGDMTFLLRHRFNDRWQGRLGGGIYSGLGDEHSLLLGLDYRIREQARLGADYFIQRPWYDPIEAADFDGQYNRAVFSFDWDIARAWRVSLEAEQWSYVVLDERDYGTKRVYTVLFTRTFSERPAFSMNYSYQRARFQYEEDQFTPIGMLESEGVHGLSWHYEQRPGPYWAYGLTGGIRRDHIRGVDSWYLLPEVKLMLGNRIECVFNYEYNSESSTVAGGETETFYLLLRIVF